MKNVKYLDSCKTQCTFISAAIVFWGKVDKAR